MKRLVRSRSESQIYGPKWQNINEGSNEIDESDDGRHSADQVSDTEAANTTPVLTPGVAAAPPTMIETNVVQPPISGNNRTGSRSDRQSMYRAALVGDWLAAEVLLGRDRSLAFVELTERGDKALHVAAAIEHTKFVQKLVEWMEPSELAILASVDGHGYTACCYAAISGAVKIADVMMKRYPIPNLATARGQDNITPLHKAALHENEEMVSYFLKSTEVQDLQIEEWFDLLLYTIRSKMYDAALEILEKNEGLAIMTNEKGTALHLLARQDISGNSITEEAIFKFQQCHRLLAQKLWDKIIISMDEASVLKLIKKPPILHDAAKVGNVELITMLTHTYPDLIWDTDSNRHTLFHIAAIYRQEKVFRLIHQIGAMKDLIAKSQDENGNNILHLVGELASLNRRKIGSVFQMQREITWFKEVEKIVPPSCLQMGNKAGHTPRELFSMSHKKLLRERETWMRNTSDSCMLIATIVLTVVFAAAFTPPGGYNGETGMPILIKSNWFTSFVVFEGLALFGATLSLLMFWSIMTSSFEEDQFLDDQFLDGLSGRLQLGLFGLGVSLIGATAAFMSAYILVFLEERARRVKDVIVSVYVLLIVFIYSMLGFLMSKTLIPIYLSKDNRLPCDPTLFSRLEIKE